MNEASGRCEEHGASHFDTVDEKWYCYRCLLLQIDAYRKMEADIAKEMGCSMSNWGENSDWCGVHDREPMTCQSLEIQRTKAQVEEERQKHESFCLAADGRATKAEARASFTELELGKSDQLLHEIKQAARELLDNDGAGGTYDASKASKARQRLRDLVFTETS